MSLNNKPLNKQQPKSVSFDTIEILQFKICLGDNPSVSTFTVPITIEWQPHKRTVLPLETFETIRPPRQDQVRKLSPFVREQILLDNGYSHEEIEIAVLEARGVSYGRASSAASAARKRAERLEEIRKSRSSLLATHRKIIQMRAAHHHRQAVGASVAGGGVISTTTATRTNLPSSSCEVLQQQQQVQGVRASAMAA